MMSSEPTPPSDRFDLIAVYPMAGCLGAEVDGVDVRNLSDETFDEIRRALFVYQVIVFRDQTLTPEAYVAFARRWGRITQYLDGLPEHPEITEILKTENGTHVFANYWHSDGMWLPVAPKATMLYALEVPPAGGDTVFSNMYAGYDTLSQGMKALLNEVSGLNALQGEEQAPYLHPLVRTHPDTGKKSLFLSDYTVRLHGMTHEESMPLLAYLRNHAIRLEFTCRLRWRLGSIAIWDSRCTLHCPVDDYAGCLRRRHRITIEDEETSF